MEVRIETITQVCCEEGIRDTSYFSSGKYAATTSAVSSSSTRSHCLRRLLQELVSLDDDLPDTIPGIWVRFDEETPQFLRVLMAAPQGTPYALGLFCFDLWIPDTYPSTPPKMQLLTTGGGTVRFSPNLYADGKVCLSLLNTWSGPKWNPAHSTILQILLSIQGLILGVQNPYYLEPGHGGWEGHVKSSTITNPYAKKSSTTTSPHAKNSETTSNGEIPNGTGGAAAVIDQSIDDTVMVEPWTKPQKLEVPVEDSKMSIAGSLGNAKPLPPSSLQPSDPMETERGTVTLSNGNGNATATATTTTGLMTNTPVVDMNVPSHVHQYEDRLRVGTVRFAMLDLLQQAQKEQPRHYLSPFKDIILSHFYHCANSIEPTITQWSTATKSASGKRQLKNTVTLLSMELKKLPKPPAVELAEAQQLAAKSSVASNGDSKMPAKDCGSESTLQTIIASKRKSMEEAAALQDYTTAARLQKELASLDQAAVTTHCSIEKRISSKNQAMEQAAEAKDYISAGKHQLSLQRLEKNKKLLQNLEKRMFDAAGKLDFVRAGRFQEQFNILLQHSDDSTDDSSDNKGIVDMPRYGKSMPSLVSSSVPPLGSSPGMSVSAAVAKAAASASKVMGGKNPMMIGFGSPPPLDDYDASMFGPFYGYEPGDY